MSKYWKTRATVSLPTALVAATMLLAFPAPVRALDWPQEIDAAEGTIVVYQPQPERLDGNSLQGRAAMSLELQDGSDPIFGVFWFESRIDVDKEAGTALIRSIRVGSTAPKPSTRPAQRPSTPTGTIDRSGLNRANAARQRGTTRQMARPGGMQRPARRR